MQNRAKHLGYWISTGIIAFTLLMGGSSQLLRTPETVAGIQQLGYPLYLLVILGTWKVLGAAALVAPRMPRLKEWAYAGVFFDLTGAVASHFFVGDAAGGAIPAGLLLVACASWSLRPASRAWQLDSQAPTPSASFRSAKLTG
jgi:uncharacterized membrane protein YphA (DoxX/SURF4 family)